MSYNSLEEIVRECQEKDLPFDEVILLDDMNERNVSREESIETMHGMWEAMKGAERNYDGSLQSRSGLVGGAGKTIDVYKRQAFMDLRLFWNERVLLVRKCFRSVRVPRTRCDSVSGKCLFRGRRCHPLAG